MYSRHLSVTGLSGCGAVATGHCPHLEEGEDTGARPHAHPKPHVLNPRPGRVQAPRRLVEEITGRGAESEALRSQPREGQRDGETTAAHHGWSGSHPGPELSAQRLLVGREPSFNSHALHPYKKEAVLSPLSPSARRTAPPPQCPLHVAPRGVAPCVAERHATLPPLPSRPWERALHLGLRFQSVRPGLIFSVQVKANSPKRNSNDYI